MVLRMTTALLLAMLGSGIAWSSVDAAVPTCNGLPATQVLQSAGTLYFTEGDDVLIGSNEADQFLLPPGGGGIGGFDYVCGRGGNDYVARISNAWIDGGSGNDELHVYDGEIFGGSGNDTIGVSNGDAHGGSGNDRIEGSHSSIYGDSGNDRITAEGFSQAWGGSGNDTIDVSGGSAGMGESGNDVMTAGKRSAVDGGSGNDRLENVGAADGLRCGTGHDTAVARGLVPDADCEIVI